MPDVRNFNLICAFTESGESGFSTTYCGYPKFGAALHGWYYEKQDGKWYFLNPVESGMVHGWSYIAGKWYFMAEASKQTYFGDNSNGWVYNKAGRPFGSMYVNEITPDGYYVNANGEWVK